MSELHDRFERLAGRGTRRGADEVLRGAMGDVSVPSRFLAPEADNTDLEVFDDDIIPFVTSEPDRRRGRFGTLVAAVGAAALVGVGALAVTALFGSGGAGSPEGAVRQLADAVAHKDPLAAVDVLVPTEVRSMRQTVSAATHRATDLKIVDTASAPLAGVDLSVDHLELSTQTLADGYAKVTITSGEISATAHRAALSKLLQDAMTKSGSGDAQGNVDLAKLASSSYDLPTFVVTVRHDGGWYVSPAYTALEYAREVAGGPAAAFGSAKVAQLGADSPEKAVTDALHAWQAGNWDGLMALAPPDELPVYDYRAWIDQEAAGTRPEFTIDKLSTSATVNGDTAVVKLDASGTTGSGTDMGTWQVGGTCAYSPYRYPTLGGSSDSKPTTETPTTSSASAIGVGGPGETVVQSGSGGGTINGPSTELCLAGDLGQTLPFGLFEVSGGGGAPATGSVSVDVVKEDGRWFVSPVSTVLDVVDSAIQHVDERTVYTLLGLAYRLPPDGTLTLDQPFTVSGSRGPLSAAVFAFDGTKAQKVLGAVNDPKLDAYASGELYSADGTDVGYVDFSPGGAYYAGTTTLPYTGSYRLVVTGFLSNGTSLTLYDAAHAPKSLLSPGISSTNGFPGETCTRTRNSETCTGRSFATPTTVPGSPGVVPPARKVTIPATSPACRRTNAGIVCSGAASSSGVATTSVP